MTFLRRAFALACCVALSLATLAAPAADVHVAVSGDDAADGATATPVRTLRRALDGIRELRAAEPDRATPIVIEVADGRHELAEPLVILPEDSGTEASPTVIRAAAGARPVVSGGREITGWQVTDANGRPRWTVELPDVKAATWNFAQLFVNDQQRFRPVLPAAGWHTIAGTLEPTPANAGKGHDRFAFAGDDLRPDWTNLGDVEVVATHRWTMSRLPILSIEPNPDDPATKIVTFAGRTRSPVAWCSFQKGNRFLVENVKEALGEPGTWYLDRPTGTLTYCPRDGESPTGSSVIAPRLDRLMELGGDVAAGKTVAHLRFEGLTFAHGNWTLPAGGQSYPQAEVNVNAAIAATAARQVVFSGCGVRHVGRYAIEFGAGCQGCTVERCEFVDLGGGGVVIGTSGGPQSWGTPGIVPGPEGEVKAIAIRDTTIANGGRLHSAAIGVWIGHASGCTVEHCHIHDITSFDYGGWGLYTDEGSTGIVMRKNLVYRTSSGGFHQHYGRDNVIENNIFAAARDWQIQRSRVEEHTSFRFERNIVWWDSDAPLVKGDWTKGLVTKANCYWHGGKPLVFPGGQDLAARQAAGQDEGSIVADPKFKDPAAGDFTLAADSPVLPLGFEPLGFEPLDPTAAGRRTPLSLTQALPEVPSIWIRPQPAAAAAAPAAQPAPVPAPAVLVPAVELQPRGGLPNFFAKAKGGGEVRVAYFGGSITAAPGWRVKSLAGLKERFPQATFVEINAAIGGTGSDLGAFRTGQDVVAGKPDLVFIEFAVNDGGAPPAQIMATMEGIVRQVRRANPAADICFVYTLSETVVPDLVAGRCQRSAAAMEAVADHYGIPSVHFGVEVARRLAAGTLTFKGPKPEPFDPAALPLLFSTDGVHPLVETGHVLYAEVLARSLAALEQAGTAAAPHQPIPPLRPDHWESATLVPITQTMLRGEWRRVTPEDDPLARTFANRMPVLWKAEQPGAALVTRVTVPEAPGVTARRVAIYDLLGPGGGVVSVRIDGGEPRKVARIDGYCTYARLATLSVGDLEPGEHEIEITLTGDTPDKRAILFESSRGDLESHPEKYAPHVWYASAILTFAAAATAD